MTATPTKLKPLFSRWCARPTCRRKVYRPMDDWCSDRCQKTEEKRLRVEARRERQEAPRADD